MRSPSIGKYPRVLSKAGGAVIALLRASVQAAVTGKSDSGARSVAERTWGDACPAPRRAGGEGSGFTAWLAACGLSPAGMRDDKAIVRASALQHIVVPAVPTPL